MHKKVLGVLNCTLKYLRGNKQFFSDVLILLLSDFRQGVPVVPHSTLAN